MNIPERVVYSVLAFPVCNFIGLNERNHLVIPEYQRGLVWSQEQKELLIDSIFENIPIGNIFLNQRGGVSDYEIVDGQQRLTTIFEFIDGGFTYQGLKFIDMPDIVKFRLEQYAIPTYITNYKKVSDIIRLYHRLNWAGTQHTVEEMLKIDKQMGEASK